MKEVEKEGYIYLGIVELDKIKEDEMKKKTIKEYKRRLRLILKSKLNGKNKITAINTWAVAVFRYGAGILQWKESELKRQCMEHYIRRAMWTDCTLRGKWEIEA